MPATPMITEGTAISAELPEWLKLAIADAVILFGRMEQKTIEIAGFSLDASLKQKLKLSQESATKNYLLVLDVVQQAAKGFDFSATKKAFIDLAAERNLIVHGSWNMVDSKPVAVWHKFLEDDNSVVGEYFEKQRFDKFFTKGQRLLDTLSEQHKLLLNAGA